MKEKVVKNDFKNKELLSRKVRGLKIHHAWLYYYPELIDLFADIQ